MADALDRGDSGERAALIAQHLRLPGDGETAAVRYRTAADRAAALLAHADALEHLEAALALEGPAADLYERIGDLRTLVGEYGPALSSYESAAALGEASALARIEHKLGAVRVRRGEWDRAEARFNAALEAEDVDPALRARIVADLSLAIHRSGRADGARELAREARDLAEAAEDPLARAQAHNLLGVLALAAHDLEAARPELERSLELAGRSGDSSAQAAALNNLALLEREGRRPEEALALTHRALELCAASGDRHREAALHNNLADLHHDAGRTDASMEHLKRAVAIFAEVGADEATRLPEVWKLVSW